MKFRNVDSRKAGVIVGLLVCIVGFMVVIANVPVDSMVEKEVWQVVDVWTPMAGEGSPGAGASGFLEIFFMNLSSADANGYGLNTSATHEGWCDANMPTASPIRFCMRIFIGIIVVLVIRSLMMQR